MDKIIHGDCLTELYKLPDESVDLVCTDPPYGYSFMGKDWDKAVPSSDVWFECMRVLKPGGFAFVMSAPRSDVQCEMISRLISAGFRLDFTPIYWTYASGFPKAMNMGKMVDKRAGVEREVVGEGPYNARRPRPTRDTNTPGAEFGFNAGDTLTAPATPEAKALDGSYGGFQPKPAVEVIIVAMKPLEEKTFVDQALKNGKGITWLDDCRVPTNEVIEVGRAGRTTQPMYSPKASVLRETQTVGRFPANLLVSDDVLNDGKKRSMGHVPRSSTKPSTWNFNGEAQATESNNAYGDTGSYSRYFDLDAWAKTLPFLIVPKASKREKNEGLGHLPVKQTKGGGGMNDPHLGSAYGSIKAAGHNFHPTVKPLKLMSYLITLGSRPGDVVLDPFLGSGTTALAAKQLNRGFIGIEREREYIEIAKARLDAIQPTLLEAAE